MEVLSGKKEEGGGGSPKMLTQFLSPIEGSVCFSIFKSKIAVSIVVLVSRCQSLPCLYYMLFICLIVAPSQAP